MSIETINKGGVSSPQLIRRAHETGAMAQVYEQTWHYIFRYRFVFLYPGCWCYSEAQKNE